MAEFKPRPTRLARQLRNNATDAERALWRWLRRRQLGGYKFSRQLPVEGFVCDFICREAKLIVEVDGGQHDLDRFKDEQRTALLEGAGFNVIRFWNNEVLENIEGVLQTILRALAPDPPLPLPLEGGETSPGRGAE